MSQHIFPPTAATSRAVEVVIGYDHPLHGLFPVVEAEDLKADAQLDDEDADADDADSFIYSNLTDIGLIDMDGHILDMAYFKAKLALFGITLPAIIESELQADLRTRAGNRFCRYDAQGVLIPAPEA